MNVSLITNIKQYKLKTDPFNIVQVDNDPLGSNLQKQVAQLLLPKYKIIQCTCSIKFIK